jgi:hypothetical protein
VDRRIKEVTFGRFLNTIKLAHFFKPKVIVFHPGYEKWKFDGDVKLWLESSLKTWRPLVKEAEERLTGQILTRSRDVLSDAFRFESLINAEITTTQRRIGRFEEAHEGNHDDDAAQPEDHGRDPGEHVDEGADEPAQALAAPLAKRLGYGEGERNPLCGAKHERGTTSRAQDEGADRR